MQANDGESSSHKTQTKINNDEIGTEKNSPPECHDTAHEARGKQTK
jgi:hypothetical protein